MASVDVAASCEAGPAPFEFSLGHLQLQLVEADGWSAELGVVFMRLRSKAGTKRASVCPGHRL